jgi:hypothetical protein
MAASAHASSTTAGSANPSHEASGHLIASACSMPNIPIAGVTKNCCKLRKPHMFEKQVLQKVGGPRDMTKRQKIRFWERMKVLPTDSDKCQSPKVSQPDNFARMSPLKSTTSCKTTLKVDPKKLGHAWEALGSHPLNSKTLLAGKACHIENQEVTKAHIPIIPVLTLETIEGVIERSEDGDGSKNGRHLPLDTVPLYLRPLTESQISMNHLYHARLPPTGPQNPQNDSIYANDTWKLFYLAERQKMQDLAAEFRAVMDVIEDVVNITPCPHVTKEPGERVRRVIDQLLADLAQMAAKEVYYRRLKDYYEEKLAETNEELQLLEEGLLDL